MASSVSILTTIVVILIPIILLFSDAEGQGLRPNGDGAEALDPVEPGDPEFKNRTRTVCDKRFRSVDGRCTNSRFKFWGSAGIAQYPYVLQRTSSKPSGDDLPSPRFISNVLCAQSHSMPNSRKLSELVVFFGQFIDHTIISTPSNISENFNIPIPKDDPFFANFSGGVLPFKRSIRARDSFLRHIKQPINSLSSALDLATIYSSEESRLNVMRTRKGGKMQTSEGNLLPLNEEGLVNSPTSSRRFFLSGDHRANEHPVLTALHTIFLREHNRLCEELAVVFPQWDDELLFQYARKINGAQFQKIVYSRWFREVTGRRLPKYTGYKPWANPSVSTIFGTAGFRVGHTMVGDHITRIGAKWTDMPPLELKDMFFNPADVMRDGIDAFIRGAAHTRAQEVDHHVVNALRNMLFEHVPQETGVDLVALNIQRGRDHALPTYNEIRQIFSRKRAESFADVTSNVAVQSALQSIYKTVDRVEAWVGLVCEDHARWSSLGQTLVKIWRMEFERLRDGDRFYYKRKHLFPRAIWRKFPRLREMMKEKDTMKSIILRNTDIKPWELRGSVWRARFEWKKM